MSSGAPVGILTKTYPKISETFILEELIGLESEGLDVQIFSLQHPTDDRANAATSEVRAPVHYPVAGLALAWVHLRLLATAPSMYARGLRRVLRLAEPDRRQLWMRAVWLADQCRARRIAHLHAHFIDTPASVAESAASLAGIPFSISAHAKDIYLSSELSLRRKLSTARFTVTCTEANHQYLTDLAGAGAKVHRVHHGVRLDRFDPAAPAADAVPHPVIIGVGRLRAKKGFDLLVEACAELRDGGIPFACRIIGYGPEEERLRAQIRRLDLHERVTLLGKLTREEVIPHYRDATLVVQPCRVTADGDRDGIPNVLLEAMAMERTVVSTTVSGIPELITDGHDGVLVPPDDSSALATALRDLLADPPRARRLARSARKTVEADFAAERSARSMAALLDPPSFSPAARVAYVVKGYPRLSELFIANEIYRVERLGLPLRLFAVKPADEQDRHQVTRETEVRPEYLPPVTSITNTHALTWVRRNVRSYRAPMRRVVLRNPLGFARALAAASSQSVRARKRRWPRKVYLKEFFQATAIADEVLRDRSIRHLHAHFCHGSTTITWLAAEMAGVTFSFTAHAKDIYQAALNPAGLLERKLRSAAFAVTCTDANRVHLERVAPGAQIHRIYHGLNDELAELIGSPREPKIDDEGPFVVLAVGRLVAKKGLDVLVEACRLLVVDGREVQLRIIGEEGDQSALLRSLCDDPPLAGRARIEGPMGQRDLFDAFETADVFALPCRVLPDGDRDGIPNVLVEAMAVGTAVVSTPVSGIPELIADRDNGLLVEADNAEALAKALAELADDEELRHRLAAAGSATVREKFDGWSEASRLVELFHDQMRQP